MPPGKKQPFEKVRNFVLFGKRTKTGEGTLRRTLAIGLLPKHALKIVF